MYEPTELTEIVELPAFLKANKIHPFPPETAKFPVDLLRDMAHLHGSELIYMKVRATYTELEVLLCSKQGCFNPIVKGTNQCSSNHGMRNNGR